MKVIYFADAMGDTEEEGESIRHGLLSIGIETSVKVTDMPPFNEPFDVLFFDWGGMSLGNSLLDSFCRQIVEQASDYPSRIYVMASEFTKWAMEDIKGELSEIPHNIFLSFEDAEEQLKLLDGKEGE